MYDCTCIVDDPPRDCLDALRKGWNKNGVYSVKPDNMSSFKLYNIVFNKHCRDFIPPLLF